MVFRPGRDDPLGVAVSLGDDRAIDRARERAWFEALKDVMWGADEIPRLIADEYLLRTSIRRKLTENHGWREVVRTVSVSEADLPVTA